MTSFYVRRHESRLDLKRQRDAVEAKPIIFKTPQGAKVSSHFNRNNSGKTLLPFHPNLFATQTKWHTFMWTAVQSCYTFAVQFGLSSLMPIQMVLYTLRNLANMVLTKLELKSKKPRLQDSNFSYLDTAAKDEVKILCLKKPRGFPWISFQSSTIILPEVNPFPVSAGCKHRSRKTQPA